MVHTRLLRNVLCSSGKMRLGRGSYLRNVDSLAKAYDSATICSKAFIADISKCASSNCSNGRCTSDGYFSPTSRATKQVAASWPAHPFCFFFLHFLPHKFQFTRTRQQSPPTLQNLSRSSTKACIPAYIGVQHL